MSTSLMLPFAVRTELEAWARAAYPREACGLLIGESLERGARVERASTARNVRPELDRYSLHPADQLAGELMARELGLEVVGVWHSHPDRPARPSERDRAAAFPGWSYVILSLDRRLGSEPASFRMETGRFCREELLPARWVP